MHNKTSQRALDTACSSPGCKRNGARGSIAEPASRVENKLRYLLITLALLSLSTFTKSDCLAYEESDYQALKGAFGITSEYSGAAGVKREQVLAFECMMQSDNRLALLNQLFEDGNIAGQLYTLAGFRSVDIVRFYEAKQKLDKQREVTVHALLGCVARKLEVATVIGWIEEGEWPTYSHVVAP